VRRSVVNENKEGDVGGGRNIYTDNPSCIRMYCCRVVFLRGKDDLALSHDVTLQYPG